MDRILFLEVDTALGRGVQLPPQGPETEIVRRRAGVPVELSKTEQKLLWLLVENRGRFLRVEEANKLLQGENQMTAVGYAAAVCLREAEA